MFSQDGIISGHSCRGRAPVILAACLISVGLLRAQPLPAQEDALRSFFLGKQVRLKIDLPATHKGIDLQLDRAEPMNWREYSERLRRFGIALRKGEHVTVTAIVVKKSMMELHLNGGGFGTHKDRSFTSESAPRVEKTSEEARLEKEVKRETDPKRREKLQRRLDSVRSEREPEQSRRDGEAYDRTEARREALRMDGGSRFNLRWKAPVATIGVTPDYVMIKLQRYIDFSELEGSQAPRALSCLYWRATLREAT
jgi:hypothetical protein